ncbi:MAG: adenylyltransferase/cytidyltransferase family protein [Alphaproteobacteria bacterium]|nr:adenylyltransferase/cytidyltransferase family protein [Alphaproteobacteria bacterium]
MRRPVGGERCGCVEGPRAAGESGRPKGGGSVGRKARATSAIEAAAHGAAIPFAEIVQDIRERAGNRKVCFISGNFNVLHPGHFRLLRFAEDNGDFLVVGVSADSANGVTVPLSLRLEGVRALGVVDYAFALPGPPSAFVEILKPDVVVKGIEYKDRYNAEQAIVESYGGRLLFGSGEIRFSSMDLLRREYFQASFSNIRKPQDFPLRHAFTMTNLISGLSRFKGLRVLVIGDIIVDTYTTCDPLGMSQEDPTIVVTPIEETTFVGGAGIVAAHASALGADVRFLTVTGRDSWATFAEQFLTKHGVRAEFFPDDTRPTTHKRRFRALNKTLLRVNELRQHPINEALVSKIGARAKEIIANADVILFADFNYGCLPQPLVDAIVEEGLRRKVMMAADSQASSQLSDISRFKNMDLVTPTEREARLALRDFESGLVSLAENLHKQANAQTVLLTLGAEGLLCYAQNNGEYMTERLPALNSAPKDVAGAGDSLFTAMTLAMRAGLSTWEAVYIGSIAAAVQVSRVGNTPLTRDELVTELEEPG